MWSKIIGSHTEMVDFAARSEVWGLTSNRGSFRNFSGVRTSAVSGVLDREYFKFGSISLLYSILLTIKIILLAWQISLLNLINTFIMLHKYIYIHYIYRMRYIKYILDLLTIFLKSQLHLWRKSYIYYKKIQGSYTLRFFCIRFVRF